MATAPGRTLDLLVPGLLGPVPVQPEQVPATQVLDRLLSRGTPLPGGAPDLTGALFAAFGQTPGDQAPSAPLCRLADDPQGAQSDPGGYWLHADPVHLRLDRDHLLLYDARHLDLTQGEANALVADFNAHFAAEGLTLVAPVPGRWYLRLAEAPRLRTQPLDAVVGRSLAGLLPTGEDARRWAGILNEAQMLFAQARPNREREAQGRLAVSGIWPWGGGDLADLHLDSRHRVVCADHPLAVGLARRAGLTVQPLAAVDKDPALVLDQGPALVVWDRLWPAVLDADPVAWAAGLRDLEAWLGQLQGRLGAGKVQGWTLDGCGAGRWGIAHSDPWRLWRRVRPLGQWLGTT